MATTQTPTTAAPLHFTESERLWRDCIASAARRAHDYYREPLADVVNRAEAIVLADGVWPDPIGSGGRVQSQSDPAKVYCVAQYCECVGSNFTPDEAPCKHMVALMIYGKAMALQREYSPHETLPEAAVSLSSYIMVGQHQVQISLRGTDALRVLDEFAGIARQYADGASASPLPPAPTRLAQPKPAALPPASSKAAAAKSVAPTVTAKAKATPPAVVLPTPEELAEAAFWNELPTDTDPPQGPPPEPPLCPAHGTPMRPSKFAENEFYCTVRDGDIYCKEKA